MNDTSSQSRHYEVLDGLRGIAALSVLLYHLFEAEAFASGAAEQRFFHGFLAVDFFLVLSGFVVGHAYDRRWDRMSVGDFIRKRFARLHPMVVAGVVIGLVCFLAQGCERWDGTTVPVWNVLVAVVLALFMIPSPLPLDVRGNTEMFPLNGPCWSLFFEYVGSLLYAVWIRRLSTRALKCLVLATAVALLLIGILGPDGGIGYGWSSQPLNMLGGFLRMFFDFPMGLLLARLFREKRRATLGSWVFPVCAVLMLGLLAVPSLGKMRVGYELLCVMVAFPALVWLGALGNAGSLFGRKTMLWIGECSYPLYMIHYPFIYLYIGWIKDGRNPFGTHSWSTPVALAILCVALSAVLMIAWERPARAFLNKKISRRSS
ncbi:MAG: acyltransferase [Bacteroidaceae bacterium]|nr:acyltransferase [Bacteroidaceae bacterium]